MATFLYRCPNTRLRVQGWSADDASEEVAYEPVRCIACSQMHYVDPATGKVLGPTTNRPMPSLALILRRANVSRIPAK
jgi:hypothetical protein